MALNFGAQILTKDLSNNFDLPTYTINNTSPKEKIHSKSTYVLHNDINDFVKDFNSLLLSMHELHFEQNMSPNEIHEYNKKMQNLVLAVKALDTKNEKQNLTAIDQFNAKLYNTVTKILNENKFPLTVGGDHIVSIGSSLASINKYKNLGIIWFDAHADFNTYNTSVTGNLHGLPLAVVANYEKTILSNFHTRTFL